MKSEIKILKLLLDKKEDKFTIKKTAEALKLNYRIAYEKTIKLEKEGLIKVTKIGNSKICEFSYKFDSKVFEAEEMRKEELFRNKDIKLIYKRIKEIKSQFYILVLFGSYANKTNAKSSDIDLCLIADDERISKEVHTILSITPIKIHLLEFTSEQFLLMLKSKEFNVGNEIIKNNIILNGIEGFYGLMNNVKQ